MGFKLHGSKTHGKPWTPDQLRSAGIEPKQTDIARSLAGNASAKEVTEGAPESEPKPGDAQAVATKRTRRRSAEPDLVVEEAKAKIIKARCQRMASLPYSLLAAMLGDPSLKLDFGEEQMLTESYVAIATAYGWEGASKLILWGDVLIVNAAIVAKRKDSIFDALGFNQEPPPAEEVKKEETVQ